MKQLNEQQIKRGSTAVGSPAYGIPDNFPASIFLARHDGEITFASDKILTLWGVARKDVVGENLLHLLAANTAPIILEKLLGKRPVANCPLDLVLPSGAEISILASAEDWDDPDGTTYRVIEVTDVSGLRQTDADALKKSFRLQSCLEATNAGTWEWNVQTGETRFNERWAEIVGYRLEELEPVSIQTRLNLAHPDDLELSSAKLEDHFSGKEAYYDIDSRMRHKDGHDVWVRDRGRVFTWTADGKPEWMFGTHFQIDREKRADDVLRRNNAMLDRMGRLAGVGGWEVDIETSQVLWSEETKRIHGVDEDYVPNIQEAISFYAPEARPTVAQAVEEGMQSGKGWDLELPFVRRNGERIWVRALGEVEFEDEKPKRIVGAFQDITDRVHDRNELIAAKDWTTFAAAKGRVGLWSLDAIIGQLNWDQQMALHFGYTPDAAPKTVAEWFTSLDENNRKRLRQAIRESMFSGADMDLELTLDAPGAATKVVKLVGAPHMDQVGTVDRLQGACFDLTEERQLLARLEEEANKLSVTLSSIGDGVITTGDSGHITWMNPQAEKLTGFSLATAKGLPSDEVLKIHEQTTGTIVACPIKQCLRTRETVMLQPNAMLRRANGSVIAIDDSVAPLFDSNQRLVGAVMVFRDTTQQRDLSRDTEFRANHDLMTGLLNRSAFLKNLEACLSDPLKQNGSYLFFVDLDHFKRINDSLGHEAGDAVLTRIAKVLRNCCKEDAVIARIGGDEFAILMRSKDTELIEDVAHQICIQAAEGILLQRTSDTSVRTGASVGIVSLGKEPLTSFEAMRRADIAAYTAKNNGRGQYCIWSRTDPSMVALS